MTKTNDIFEENDVPLPSSDDESDDEPTLDDDDTCTPYELQQCFPQMFSIRDETAVSLKKHYILKLEKDDSFTRLAAGLSDGSVHIFDISVGRGLSYSSTDCIPTPPATTDPKNCPKVCGVRFVDETPNLLLIGTTDNKVRMFDLRTQGEVCCFQSMDEEGSTTMPKNFVAFDRNANSRIMCVGTEQHNSNVFLLFFDIRERKQLGGYFESHHDDVTALRFHPHNPDLLCSGSTDGLVNIFDIKQSVEDEALLTTFNTVSSVHKVNWHKNVYDKDFISCITHTNDLKMYDCSEGELVEEFSRSKITESIKRKTEANCNLIDCHNMEDGKAFLLAGSYLNKGEILRSLIVQNKQLLPGCDFQGNKQIIRESAFDLGTNALLTAGESGIITLWTSQPTSTLDSAKLKVKKKKLHKTTPY